MPVSLPRLQSASRIPVTNWPNFGDTPATRRRPRRGDATGRQKIILFVTQEKESAAEQYEDELADGVLRWEGPTDHSPRPSVVAGQAGEEIHLFYRERHHSDFVYQECFRWSVSSATLIARAVCVQGGLTSHGIRSACTVRAETGKTSTDHNSSRLIASTTANQPRKPAGHVKDQHGIGVPGNDVHQLPGRSSKS